MMDNYIVKNAKVYTQNKAQPWAESFAVENGKFTAVGSEDQVAEYAKAAGSAFETLDAEGRFIMPGIIDSHTHIALSVMLGGDDEDDTPMYDCESKAEVLDKLREMKKKHPFAMYYCMFYGYMDIFRNDPLTRDDIDKIIKHRPVILMDNECHSAYLNSGALKYLKISEDTEDLAEGYSMYGRDENGRLNGFMTEMTMLPIMEINADIGEDEMRAGLAKLCNYLVSHGVTTVFDAGQFFKEDWTYGIIRKMMDEGKFPLRMEGTHILNHPDKVPGAIEEYNRLKKEYESDQLRFNTMKMMLDGTRRIHTACMVEPYADTGSHGGTLIPKEQLKDLLRDLNREGIDFHVHTVGSGAVRMVLDCVQELKEEGEFNIIVTCAHDELIEEEDLGRFRELGVIANFTPSWNGGNCDYGGVENLIRLFGEERSQRICQLKTLWNTGATMTFSSDEVELQSLDHWSPFWGMEVGMTRQDPDFGTKREDGSMDASGVTPFPNEEEVLELEQFIEGYTINGARQLRMEDRLGSIEEGKEADFLILHENLFEMDKYRIHDVIPDAVYIRGVKCGS